MSHSLLSRLWRRGRIGKLDLDRRGQPLMPCHPARARKLLAKGRAVVVRRFPFAIRLKDRESGAVQGVKLKCDPGAKVSGMALVRAGITWPWEE